MVAIDVYSRECLTIEGAFSISAEGAVRVLERLREERGLPELIITNYGPGPRSRGRGTWAYARGVKPDYTQPGRLVQNPFIGNLKWEPVG